MSYQTPGSFPKGYLLGGILGDDPTSSMVNPIQLDYQTLKNVVHTTHNNLADGTWSPTVASTYLVTNGISTKFAQRIVNLGKNCQKYRLALENRDRDPKEYDDLEKDREKYPSEYAMAKIPSVWERDLPLSLYIDTPMHLLFLGIAKTVFWYVGLWCNRSGRGKVFKEMAVNRLLLLDRLKLQWLSFNATSFMSWKGWAAEKYQSLCRVALWVYGPLMKIDESKPFEEPETDFEKWYVSDYRKWLEVRGLPSTGNKNVLRDRIRPLRALPENEQPQIKPKEYGDAKEVLQLIRSMILMLTTILQPGVQGQSHARILSLRVRLFLSALEEFEVPMRRKKKRKKKKKQKKGNNNEGQQGEQKEEEEEDEEEEEEAEDVVPILAEEEGIELNEEEAREVEENNMVEKQVCKDSKPVWLARFNFMSLLNLPETILEFGSPRNYFEGQYRGERFVQEVKNVRKQCPPTNVSGTLLRKLHEGKSLEFLVGAMSTSNLKTHRLTEVVNKRADEKKKQLVGNMRVYKSRRVAIKEFHSNRPLCVLETPDNIGILFYVGGSNRGAVKYLKLQEKSGYTSVFQGNNYWKWKLTKVTLDFSLLIIQDFVVLLPKNDPSQPRKRGEIWGEYTLASKEWSPRMLEHYEYSTVGIVQAKDEQEQKEEDGWV